MAKKIKLYVAKHIYRIKKTPNHFEKELLIYLVEVFYINLLIMKPFFLINEKETNEIDEDTEFTASLLTAIFGRYDNESPPLIMFF